MKIYDITRTTQDAPLYPGSAPMTVETLSDMSGGEEYNLTKITADSHTGTHADAFSHFLPDSGVTVDRMPLQNYCGKCRLMTVEDSELITLNDIRGRLGGFERVALRGGGQAYLSEEAAEYLAMCRVKLVVTDAVSVAPPDNETAIHQILMEAGCAIVENAVFDEAQDGDYLIFAFPVKYGGCDGAPVRAVLVGAKDGFDD